MRPEDLRPHQLATLQLQVERMLGYQRRLRSRMDALHWDRRDLHWDRRDQLDREQRNALGAMEKLYREVRRVTTGRK